MLIVNKLYGQMGNQILHYNNLVQLSHIFEQDSLSLSFTNNHLFNLNNLSKNTNQIKIDETLTSDMLLKGDFLIDDKKNYLIDTCLYELFFKYNKKSTFEIFKLNRNLPFEPKKQISIHFRGTDYKIWDPNSQLNSEYYINSIDYITKTINDEYFFKIFTDDTSLKSYNDTLSYLTDNKKDIRMGNKEDVCEDFISLSNSEYIISSPSTFCICAAFCGKKDKKIIQSEKWMKYKLESDYIRDIFWKELNNGGNDDYKLWVLI
jgi:hypothetical protein